MQQYSIHTSQHDFTAQATVATVGAGDDQTWLHAAQEMTVTVFTTDCQRHSAHSTHFPFGSGARKALRASQPGRMRMIMDVSFTDGSIRVSTMPPCMRITGRCATPLSNLAVSYLQKCLTSSRHATNSLRENRHADKACLAAYVGHAQATASLTNNLAENTQVRFLIAAGTNLVQ